MHICDRLGIEGHILIHQQYLRNKQENSQKPAKAGKRKEKQKNPATQILKGKMLKTFQNQC